MASPAELLQTELRAKLDGQLATLESSRNRAIAALSVSGIIVGLVFQHIRHHVGHWGLGALIAFVVGGVAASWVLGPHKMTLHPTGADWASFAKKHYEWVQGQCLEGFPARDATNEMGAVELAVRMNEDMMDWYWKNDPMIRHVSWVLVVAYVALIVQVVCWAGSTIH